MHAGGSGLQEQHFVSGGVLVSDDFRSRYKFCRHKDQMRGAAVLRINLQNEGLSRIGVAGPPPHHPPFAFVHFKNEWSGGRQVRLRFWR